MKRKYADIAVGLPIKKTYSYSIPSNLELEIGSMVLIPFGRRRITGYVVGFKDSVEFVEVKNVISLIYPFSVFNEETLEFYRLVAENYLSSLGEVIKMALPKGLEEKSDLYVRIGENPDSQNLKQNEKELIEALRISNAVPLRSASSRFALNPLDVKRLHKNRSIDFFTKIKSSKIKAKTVRFYELNGSDAGNYLSKSKKENEILNILIQKNKKVSIEEFKKNINGYNQVLKRLVQKGILKVEEIEMERTPYLEKKVSRDKEPQLFEDQKNAVDEITNKLGSHITFLLHGITGSGKTEVYLRLISKVLAKGKNAMALVPEIALTPQFVHRFRARFGDIISVLHSSMSKGERFDQWRKILRGDARIVIGARSALFAPLQNVGIMVVDEEHDHSYKQEERIMYNAKDLAIERAKMLGAVVVLGSATPSLESYYKAMRGSYKLLKLSKRATDFGLPDVDIVDLRKEKGKFGKRSFLSDTLINAIKENSEGGGKAILFLNRRGYSQAVVCTTCGVSVKCPDCAVSLKYHDAKGKLICHYCDYSVDMFGFCNTCNSRSLVRLGFGTEQIEKEIKAHFPDLSVERMDRDTTQKKFSHERIIRKLESGKIDILIGTQMVSKGLDAKGVSLVGVVLADVSLNLPDFRSCEKTFSLLTQVAGRSGRGMTKGKVIIQTYNPEHYSINEAKNQDFPSFFEKEINFRKDIEYPPFVRLANLRFSSPDEDLLNGQMKRMKKIAVGEMKDREDYMKSIEILGPSPAPIEKLRGQYRWQMLIKGKDESIFNEYIRVVHKELGASVKKHKSIIYRMDIDPHDFM